MEKYFNELHICSLCLFDALLISYQMMTMLQLIITYEYKFYHIREIKRIRDICILILKNKIIVIYICDFKIKIRPIKLNEQQN